MIAVFVSVVIHSFLAYLLWTAVSGRTAVEPAAPATDTHLILSLSTFTPDSHDEMDLEVVSEVPRTDPPARGSEPSRSEESKSEAETVVTSKDQDVPVSETLDDKSPATDATPSFDLEAVYNMKLDFGIKLEFKAETVMTSKGRGILSSGSPENISLTACLNPSFGLEAVSCMEREFGRMPESETQNIIFKSRMLFIKNYTDEYMALHEKCKGVGIFGGLLAIPLLLKETIVGNECVWEPDIIEIE
ncbi:MAG: hypothetical protein PVG39_25570 [Desulfobacteraceae bacterium]